MKTSLVLLTVVFGFSMVAFALPPRPCLGVSASFLAVAEDIQVPPYSDVGHSIPPNGGMGIQTEGGVLGDFWSAYGGLRYSNSYHGGHGWDAGQSWTIPQFVAGARIRVSDLSPNPVKPMIGGGASYGWVNKTANSDVQNRHSLWSKPGFGWFGEFGTFVRVHPRYYVSGVFRYEYLNANFGGRPNPYADWIRGFGEASFQLGLTYDFSRTK